MNYLSLKSVQKKLDDRSRSSIYRDVEKGRLPKPIKLGCRLYWIEAEIDAALTSLAD